MGKTVKYLLDKDVIKAGGITTIKALLALLHFTASTLIKGLMIVAADTDGRRLLAMILIPMLGYYHGIDMLLYVCKGVSNGLIAFIPRLLDTISNWFDKDTFVEAAIEILSGVLVKSGVSDAFTEFARSAAANSVNTEVAVNAIQTSADAMVETSTATMNLIMDLNQAEQNTIMSGVFSQLSGLAVEGVKQYITNGGRQHKTKKNRKRRTRRVRKNNSRKKRTIKRMCK